jgi:hypothetical protein
MTFTELELVLLLGNIAFAVMYFLAKKEQIVDKHMTAMLLNAIADGEAKVTRKHDGGISIQAVATTKGTV